MSRLPTVLAIINPLSGTISGAQKTRLRDTFLRQAEALGYVPQAVVTEHPGHATELAAEAVAQSVNRVMVIGGDGTINETARALRRSNTALGIVPVGSGNGLARHLGLPLNPPKALERALAGRPVMVDSGEINEHPFFCTAGLGFEAYVAHQFARQSVRGLSTYVRTAFRSFWTYQPGTYRLNGVEKKMFSLTFANAGQFGNNAWVAPTANIADGRLEQCEIRPFPVAMGGLLAYRLFSKTLDQSAYWHGQSVTQASVEVDGPLLIHADGEPLTLHSGRAEVRVLPSSLLVLM